MKRSKTLLIVLLVSSCVLTSILLFTIPSQQSYEETTLEDFEFVIEDAFQVSGVQDFRKSKIQIDSSFTRIVYRVNVNPSFSKTSFHLLLNSELQTLDVETPAKVVFPEEHMDIHLVHQNTVLATIRLLTDDQTSNEDTDG